MKKRKCFTPVLVLTTLCFTAPVASSSWASTADGPARTSNFGGVQLNNVFYQKCLDADLAQSEAAKQDTRVSLYPCHEGFNQKWIFNQDGSIVNVHYGKCLDADMAPSEGAKPDTRVSLYPCHGKPNQKWALQPNGNLVNMEYGKCLDADMAVAEGQKPDTRVSLYSCHNGSNQQWN